MILRDQIIQDWTTLKELINSNQQFHWGQLLSSLGINSLDPQLTLAKVIQEIAQWQEQWKRNNQEVIIFTGEPPEIEEVE